MPPGQCSQYLYVLKGPPKCPLHSLRIYVVFSETKEITQVISLKTLPTLCYLMPQIRPRYDIDYINMYDRILIIINRNWSNVVHNEGSLKPYVYDGSVRNQHGSREYFPQ